MKFGNLVIAGLVTGSIYAVFAVCVSVWYRVSNILNLAVGDFAMLGALGVDDLVRVRNWPLPAAIITTLAVVAAFGYVYDRVVLTMAQEGRSAQEGIVVTFFFTFALSFFIDGVARVLFGTDVHAAPALWSGRSLTLLSGLHLERAGILVLVLAMLAAKPQIILFGLVRGTDSITAIRAIRAQNANIPISECSACELPSFIAADGTVTLYHA